MSEQRDYIPETFYSGWVAGIALLECKVCSAAVPIYGELGEPHGAPLFRHEQFHKQGRHIAEQADE